MVRGRYYYLHNHLSTLLILGEFWPCGAGQVTMNKDFTLTHISLFLKSASFRLYGRVIGSSFIPNDNKGA